MPTSPLPSVVVLMGMMGSGKTSVGRALAKRTGWPYLDNDELVRQVTGRQPEEIDASDGEAILHEAEAAALRHALTMPPPLIVAAAAWCVQDPASVDLLRGAPGVVYLRARPVTLHARIGSGRGRRDEATDLEWLRARFIERDAIYREIATFTIDTDELDVTAVVERIVEVLESRAETPPVRD